MTVRAAPKSRCIGLPSSIDSPCRMVHPRARELYEHLRTFPWDVSCLTYLRCRHSIFPEVFSGKSTTTKLVEYLVELRFLATALNGWSEVALGRSPHHLAPLDKRFVVFSIANACHELPDVLKELMMIKERSYSSAVKKYCDEVHASLSSIYTNCDVKNLSHYLCLRHATNQRGIPPHRQLSTTTTTPPFSQRFLITSFHITSSTIRLVLISTHSLYAAGVR